MKNLYLISLAIFIVACTQKEQEQANSFTIKTVKATGYVVPKDSVSEPIVIPIDESKLTKIPVGKPMVVPTNTNIHLAINTNIHQAGTPRVCTPGLDTFALPKTVPAIDSPFVAGIPEVVIAKDAYIKDQNPQNFSSFSKLQGLKHGVISCMLQDQSGNLWFGTKGGGVSKYDGKSFTHFTEKEGLSNNSVLSILQDQSGNLWFGTSGGVSKYDGKSFTHFTEKEGLSNNRVLSILQDQSGNLWFGTEGGGVSKLALSKVEGYDTYTFTHFTEKEGLSNNIVLSILQDQSGNLWFGTYGGVSKYDGNRVEEIEARIKSGETISERDQQDFKKENGKLVKSFTHFTEKEGLSNNIVFSILQDQSGNLWFGTYGGVSKYDGNRVEEIEARIKSGETISERDQQDFKKENGKLVKSFTHFTEKEGLSNNIVFSILQDQSGNLWFGTEGGVSKYDGKSFTHFTEKEGLSNNIVFSILQDQSGNLWFGTYGGGVSKYDGKSFTHFTEKEGLSNNIVRSILQDQSGNLWFGTYGGVSKYDGKSFTHFTEKEGLSNNSVFSILQDQSGNLWFGTSGGVSKYDGKSFTHFTEKEGLSNNSVWSILQDQSGNLWFGTYGGGVSKYDGKSFTHFTEKEGLSNNSVLSILQDQSGNLWFGTSGGVSKYDGKSFTHFTEKEGLSNNRVLSILQDQSGNLWFGTYGGGVSKYDGNRVEEIEARIKSGETISERDQQDFKKENGKLVKSFTHFTEKEGLSDNYVFSMLQDKSGNLWFGTRFGLSKFSEAKLVALRQAQGDNGEYSIKEDNVFFKNYGYEDGFLGIGIYGGKTICEAKDGTIWVGANDRLTAYHPPVGGDKPDTIVPNVQLTSIALFNENVEWVNLAGLRSPAGGDLQGLNAAKDTTFTLGNGVIVGNFEFDGLTRWYNLPENLSLAYNNNYLTFKFIGITMNQPKKVKYQYKLEGIDENWSAITNRTEAPYGNLPQGSYTFKVKAMNSEGYWSEPFEYTFTIRPPWWLTWWMYTFYGILIIFTVFFIVWWNGRKLRARAEQLKEEVEKATKEIAGQKKELEVKHEEILASIRYAKRIQDALLTSQPYIERTIKRLKKS